MAEWVEDWAAAPYAWRSSIFHLADFNADQVRNPGGKPIVAYAHSLGF